MVHNVYESNSLDDAHQPKKAPILKHWDDDLGKVSKEQTSNFFHWWNWLKLSDYGEKANINLRHCGSTKLLCGLSQPYPCNRLRVCCASRKIWIKPLAYRKDTSLMRPCRIDLASRQCGQLSQWSIFCIYLPSPIIVVEPDSNITTADPWGEGEWKWPNTCTWEHLKI